MLTNEGKPNSTQGTIGVRQSFTQKPPTDLRQQHPLYQKNLKYLDGNRLGGTMNAGLNGNTMNDNDKFNSTG